LLVDLEKRKSNELSASASNPGKKGGATFLSVASDAEKKTPQSGKAMWKLSRLKKKKKGKEDSLASLPEGKIIDLTRL